MKSIEMPQQTTTEENSLKMLFKIMHILGIQDTPYFFKILF